MRHPIRPIVPFFALLVAACAVPAAETVPAPAPAPAPQPAPQPAPACTLIGCEDGWTIHIDDSIALPATYTVRVLVDGDVVASVTCSPDRPCGDQVFLAGVTAAEAQLEIVGGTEALRWTVRPEYNVVQPNGPDCPPTCRQARVHVRLDG